LSEVSKTTRFCDLYAGIGGIRLGFQQAYRDEAEFVFSSEIDDNACSTYKKNFDEKPRGDITQIESKNIPDFDILLAGFPCQSFSIAGRREGFEDIRGTHFFEIRRIIRDKQPAAFLLENVKHFRKHDGGNTFKTVKNVIEDELGYTFYDEVLNAKDFGLPQNRERVYMVGFKDPINFEFPKPSGESKTIADILEELVSEDYFLSQRYLDTLIKHRKRHERKGNGFGYIILDEGGIANTIVLGGMGRERNLIKDENSYVSVTRESVNDQAVRCLTPREFLRLQGFDDDFVFEGPKTHLYNQAANSVAVPVIREIARCMKKALKQHELKAKQLVAQ